MAVPPAPDGAVADATKDSATPSSPLRTARSRARLLTALVALIIGCLVSLGVLLVLKGEKAEQTESGVSAQPQAQREELMSQVQQFVIRVNTYGPSWLDEQNRMPRYVEGVRELLTAKFAAGFEQSVVIPERQVAQSGYGRSAQVFAVGVASMDEEKATVLVGFVRTDSYPKPRDPTKRLKLPGNPERWAVELLKTEGEWLVDNYAVISEVPDDVAVPEGQPSGSPAPTAPTVPSGGATP